MTAFIRRRLTTNEISFHDPIPKLKLAFSPVKIGGKEVMLFARLLIVAQTRDRDLQEVFQYSLGPFPWSLASVDGSLCKTVKSKLLETLIEGVKPTDPPTAALIVDGMVVLQAMKEIPGHLKSWRLLFFI